MAKRDYYEVLGLSKKADAQEIKKSYRAKAMEFHPDRNSHDPAAEEKFKEASEAYEVLSDPKKREIYDQFGHAGFQGPGGFHGFSGNMEDVFGTFSDIFEDFFGGGGRRGARGGRRPQKGGDVEATMKVTFSEVIHGSERKMQYYQEGNCDSCSGKGSQSGELSHCPRCKGSGHIAHQQGFFMVQAACPQCRGSGTHMTDPCDDCRGVGRVRKKKDVKVHVPEGIDHGMHLILRGEGNTGLNGGPPGDLYVLIHVEGDAYFTRHGDDLHSVLKISMTDAALGTQVKIRTTGGEKEITIPEGINSGEEISLKKMGVPNVRNKHRGNQIIKVIVETPKNLSKRQKKLLQDFNND